jgi:four helix bundle protein
VKSKKAKVDGKELERDRSNRGKIIGAKLGTNKEEANSIRSDGRRDIQERTFSFALSVIRLCKKIDGRSGVGRVLALQLLRAGTSVGANVEEAQAGQSRADFISKYSIALKEIRETRYWLPPIEESDIVDCGTINPLLQESVELGRIPGAIVSRTKQGPKA